MVSQKFFQERKRVTYLLGITFVISAALLLYLYTIKENATNSGEQRINLSQINTDTNNWTTYKNKDLGFSIKYPPEVIIHQEGPSSVTFTTEKYKDSYPPLPIDLFIGRRGEMSGDPIEALKEESPILNGVKIPKQYRLVQINNAFGGQVLYNNNFIEDYYLTDSKNSGYPLRILLGDNDPSIDTQIFKQMISTFEFIRH